MAEWSIEHAWKSDRFTRADAHQIPPTHSRSTTSRNIDTRRHVLVNHRIDRGFEGVCDTVLTQRRRAVAGKKAEAYGQVRRPTPGIRIGIRRLSPLDSVRVRPLCRREVLPKLNWSAGFAP